jgi:hypothetical protein
MITKATPPSRNTANDDSLLGFITLALMKDLQNTDDMLPAKVIAYDRVTNRASVQPLIVMVNTNNEQIPRAQISSIPVLQLGGGGFVLSFPLNTGDLGWIKANDRDISLFLTSLAQSPPNTIRKHTFQDAIFIPDTMFKSVTINEEDADNAVIQSLDGTCRIAISNGSVKITAPEIIFDSPATSCTGSFETGTNPAYPDIVKFNPHV